MYILKRTGCTFESRDDPQRDSALASFGLHLVSAISSSNLIAIR